MSETPFDRVLHFFDADAFDRSVQAPKSYDATLVGRQTPLDRLRLLDRGGAAWLLWDVANDLARRRPNHRRQARRSQATRTRPHRHSRRSSVGIRPKPVGVSGRTSPKIRVCLDCCAPSSEPWASRGPRIPVHAPNDRRRHLDEPPRLEDSRRCQVHVRLQLRRTRSCCAGELADVPVATAPAVEVMAPPGRDSSVA